MMTMVSGPRAHRCSSEDRHEPTQEQRPLFAHLTTVSDGGPGESPVWFLWEDNTLWLIASDRSSYTVRLQKDTRAAVGIVDFDLARGFLQHVGMRGTGK